MTTGGVAKEARAGAGGAETADGAGVVRESVAGAELIAGAVLAGDAGATRVAIAAVAGVGAGGGSAMDAVGSAGGAGVEATTVAVKAAAGS